MAKLKAKVTEDNDYIHLKISKDNFEAFCGTVGLFKSSFLRTLEKSEKDLKEGRYTSRKTLNELITE
jgi:ABC-type phosphate transport system ATPase subunit